MPVGQHVQASFIASGPASNLYKLAALGFSDGTVRLGARLPAGTTLVLTDVHVQIFRLGTDVSQPLDGFIQLSSGDVTGATDGIQLTNVPLHILASGYLVRASVNESSGKPQLSLGLMVRAPGRPRAPYTRVAGRR